MQGQHVVVRQTGGVSLPVANCSYQAPNVCASDQGQPLSCCERITAAGTLPQAQGVVVAVIILVLCAVLGIWIMINLHAIVTIITPEFPGSKLVDQ